VKNESQKMNIVEEKNFKSKIEEKYEKEGSAYYSSARLWDDGIIMPSQTRIVMGLALNICLNPEIQPTNFGVFRM